MLAVFETYIMYRIQNAGVHRRTASVSRLSFIWCQKSIRITEWNVINIYISTFTLFPKWCLNLSAQNMKVFSVLQAGLSIQNVYNLNGGANGCSNLQIEEPDNFYGADKLICTTESEYSNEIHLHFYSL